MRLNFNVLWIDDQPGNLSGYISLIRLHIEKEGFQLRTEHVYTFEDAEKHLSDSVFMDNIDLVLVDYNLGQGVTGEVAVSKIRRRVPFKDIIFYTALPTKNLYQMIVDQEVEGVFCAYRDELPDKVIGVFSNMVKKVLDIDHCRGIVMGATSDVDQVVEDCVVALSLRLEDPNATKFENYIDKIFSDKVERLEKLRETFPTMEINAKIDRHDVITTFDRLRLLIKLIELHSPDDQKRFVQGVKDYLDQIPKRRNTLAHKSLLPSEDDDSSSPNGRATITEEQMRKLRCSLIQYRDLFQEVAVFAGLQPLPE